MDDLFVTQWDTTRCSASSAVAMVSLAGPAYVERLAAWVVDTLEARVANVWRLVDGLDAKTPDARAQARAAFLPEVQRHIQSFKLSLNTALFELGYDTAKEPGLGVGVPPHLGEEAVLVSDGKTTVSLSVADPFSTALTVASAPAPAAGRQWFVRDGVGPDATAKIDVPVMHADIPWYRVSAESAEAGRIELQTKGLDLAGATQVLAVYQLTGEELRLADRVIDCLEAELTKARGTLEAMRRGRADDPPLLQQLADSVLVSQQHSAVGLNAAETAEALQGAGLPVAGTGKAVPWAKLGAAVTPGEFLLLEGQGHAVTFGRLRDGRAFVYDSEGICGDRNASCLALVEPGKDAAVDAHYRPFQATHRCRPARVLDVIAWQAILRG